MTLRNPLLALLLATLLTPSATALAALPAEPHPYHGHGLDLATFQVRLRTHAGDGEHLTLHLGNGSHARAALAPGNGTPGPWRTLTPNATLPLPERNASCWRGWCGVVTLHVRLRAPNHDGSTVRPLTIAGNRTALEAPLRFDTTPRRLHATANRTTVQVHVVGPPPEALHLLHGADAWPTHPTGNGTWSAGVHTLPPGVPLRPTAYYPDGARLQGQDIVVSPEPTANPSATPEPPAMLQGTDAPPSPRDASDDAPSPNAPATSAEPDGEHLPVPTLSPLAALLLATLASRVARRRRDGSRRKL